MWRGKKIKEIKKNFIKITSENFLSKIDKDGPFCEKLGSKCWSWIGSKDKNGYGLFSFDTYSHRISYEFFKGEILSGLVIDHLCRNTNCCNPDHLEAVTNKENVLRGIGPSALNAKKTYCSKGHLYDKVKKMVNVDVLFVIMRKLEII